MVSPGGGASNTLSCASAASSECSGNTHAFEATPSVACSVRGRARVRDRVRVRVRARAREG